MLEAEPCTDEGLFGKLEVEERRSSQPLWGLAGVLFIFVIGGLLIGLGTPPWEANDEPDHLRNVESLIAGEMYRVGSTGGLESHQPPLYYLLLAGWQKGLGIPEHGTKPSYIVEGGPQLGLWEHSTSQDGSDQRFVSSMRLTGLILGMGVIVLTFATARLLSTSKWTPLVAAAIVAGIPKFVFLSAVVNNDNLANLLTAAVVYVSVRALTRAEVPTSRSAVWTCSALGLLVGLSLITKLTAVAIILPAALAAGVIARRAHSLGRCAAVFSSLILIPSLPWIWFTYREYDDPFAGRVSGEYFDRVIPGLMRKHVDLEVFTVELPTGLWKTFWYSSGWNQYSWPWAAYLPFWLIFAPAFVVGGWRLASGSVHRTAVGVLGSTVLASLVVFVYIGTITTGTQARVTFVGLVALAVTVSVGLERFPLPARFALPAMGLIGTFIAFRTDVVEVFFR